MKTIKEIQAIIDNMSIEQKAGQLFLLAYPGKDPEKIRPLIEKYGICGCYISQDNAETFEEACAITDKLQKISGENHHPPLLLGVDQEGAWGILVPESHPGPGNMALASLHDTKEVSAMYEVFGDEMVGVGYNAILGPCADVNSNPRSPIIGTRSFGENPEYVATCVEAAIQGLKQTKALSCIKHFPGHGATANDTHRLIPEVDKSLSELLQSDLIPFKKGIEAGCDIVMTSHIRYPRIDPENPATLSSIILEDILRDKLGFTGIILSDSMNMGAIRKVYDPAESTLKALRNGVDVVMLSEEHYDYEQGDYLAKQIASIELVRRAISDGTLDMDMVDAKLLRILDIKFNRMAAKRTPQDPEEVRSYETTELRIASECPCLLQKGLWPLPDDHDSIIYINATPRQAYSNIMNSRGIGPNQEEPAFDSFKEIIASETSSQILEHEEVAAHQADMEQTKAIVVVTEDYPLPGEDFRKEEQQALVKKLCGAYPDKLIIVGLRSSYELSEYPKNITYLCTYSSRTCTAKAAARTLLSRIDMELNPYPPVSVRF